jgi:transcription-repair coupling factor (superfamily II helicase)
VHNRIATIERLRERLERFLPDVRVVVGHGQMKPAELERVMHSFIEGEYDILLSTSIIESGLDLPAVNTIFIDNAWQFGLADLYQLRGRVGRSHHRAYCYLITSTPLSRLQPEARNRLETIRRYTELGSGWHVAMRDLEIRGAGEFLGSSQHGHLESIGYSMFEELIRSEVSLLRRQPDAAGTGSVRVEIPGEAFIPESYMPDVVERVRLYRSVWRAGSEEEIDGWKDFVRDRFGELPDPVHNAAERARLHLLARKAGAEEAVASSAGVRLVFAPGSHSLRRVGGAAAAAGGKAVEEKTGRIVLTCPASGMTATEGRGALAALLRLFF